MSDPPMISVAFPAADSSGLRGLRRLDTKFVAPAALRPAVAVQAALLHHFGQVRRIVQVRRSAGPWGCCRARADGLMRCIAISKVRSPGIVQRANLADRHHRRPQYAAAMEGENKTRS